MSPRITIPEPSNPILYRIVGLVKRVILMPRSFILKVVLLQGKADDKSKDLRLIYIGERESLEYIKNQYFSEITQSEISISTIWQFKKRMNQFISNTIVLVEINRLLQFLVPNGGFVSYPWIRQSVNLKDEFYKGRKRKIEDLYGRKVRKNNYRFQITQNIESVNKFYYDIYSPYMKSRYGEDVYLRSISEIRNVMKTGFLLKVFDEDILVAGAVCRLTKRRITAYTFSVAQNYQYHLKRGALSAVYYFLFKWAEQNDVDTVDLLRSRPHLDDGVFEHKRRWGANAQKDVWPHTFIEMFIPKNVEVPTKLNRHLVWQTDKFRSLEEAADF